MAKNVVEDMIKTPKREPSVFFSELAKATNKTLSPDKPKTKNVNTRPVPRSTASNLPPTGITPGFVPARPRKHTRIWIIATASVLVLFFALSFAFSGAKVTVIPKSFNADIATDFSAEKDAILPSLPFQLMTINASEQVTTPSTGNKIATSKATGSVVLFNEYSTTTQNLLINTRLEAANGKIYYTDKAVSIPGYKKSGSTVIPGSVEVSITAFEAGDTYNSPLTDFKIVGFKTSPDKYEKIYGRSRTEILGGQTGSVYTISTEAANEALVKATENLKTTLMTQARSELPEGFVLYDNALFISIPEVSAVTDSKETDVVQTVSGTAQAFIFKRSDLTSVIAKTFVSGYDGSPVHIPEIEELTFTLKNKESIVPATVKDISINLSGSARIIWDVDTEALSNSVLGKKKKEFQSIMAANPNVQSAEVVLKPFWEINFPKKLESIDVVVSEI